MYLSLDWIKNWVKLPRDLSAKQIALDLTMATVEVEEIIDESAQLKDIVVGKIEELSNHPDADRLQVCRVNLGDSVEQIVCGGINLSKGMLVAVAKVGSRVKWHGQGDLVTLAKTKIRGVESSGMIAAAEEIGLADIFPQSSEKEILDLSNLKVKVGQSLSQALELNDIIIDIDNKSINHRPDLWGQYGLARELAAIYKLKLQDYKISELKAKDEIKLKVSVDDKDNCFRYMAGVVKNVQIAPSPLWLKKKLSAVGIRPINNIVDVTNYVMYELGQPLHAFDADHIEGGEIVVKLATKGEKFVTLDGVSRKLTAESLMIADAKKYVALAGIMGGQNSEIGSDTTTIVLESANFRAANIRRTSVALSLRSESSARFEKSLDPLLTDLALRRTIEMILTLCPEAYLASTIVDINNNPFKVIDLIVPEELINRRFGVIIPTAEIKDILKRLQFGVEYKAKTLAIRVPSFRATKDISIPEDIVEEVARIYGYDNIDAKLPQVTLQKPDTDLAIELERNVKRFLAGSQVYDEVFTYPFTEQAWVKKLGLDLSDHLQVKNALSPEQTYLSISLLPNLLKKAEANLRWFNDFRIFELDRVFHKKVKGIYHLDFTKKKFLPRQEKQLAGIEVGPVNLEQAFFVVKGLVESMMDFCRIDWQASPTELTYAAVAYDIKFQDTTLGQFGVLKPGLFDSGSQKVSVAFWHIDFSLLVKYVSRVKKYQPLPKFPAVNRDMAIVVDQGVTWQDIAKEVGKLSSLIKSIVPFDVFTGQGVAEAKKSVAFHLEFRSDDRTLLTEDVDKLIQDILLVLHKKFKAVLR